MPSELPKKSTPLPDEELDAALFEAEQLQGVADRLRADGDRLIAAYPTPVDRARGLEAALAAGSSTAGPAAPNARWAALALTAAMAALGVGWWWGGASPVPAVVPDGPGRGPGRPAGRPVEIATVPLLPVAPVRMDGETANVDPLGLDACSAPELEGLIDLWQIQGTSKQRVSM